MKRDYKVLELDKILELLASETSCEGAAKIARGLSPFRPWGSTPPHGGYRCRHALTARFGSPHSVN